MKILKCDSRMGLYLQNQYLGDFLSQPTKTGTKLKLRHWPFTNLWHMHII